MNNVASATADGFAAIDLAKNLGNAAPAGADKSRAAFDATLSLACDGAVEAEPADEASTTSLDDEEEAEASPTDVLPVVLFEVPAPPPAPAVALSFVPSDATPSGSLVPETGSTEPRIAGKGNDGGGDPKMASSAPLGVKPGRPMDELAAALESVGGEQPALAAEKIAASESGTASARPAASEGAWAGAGREIANAPAGANASASASPSPSPSASPSPSPSPSPNGSATATAIPSATSTPTATAPAPPTPTATATPSAIPSATSTAPATAPATLTATPSAPAPAPAPAPPTPSGSSEQVVADVQNTGAEAPRIVEAKPEPSGPAISAEYAAPTAKIALPPTAAKVAGAVAVRESKPAAKAPIAPAKAPLTSAAELAKRSAETNSSETVAIAARPLVERTAPTASPAASASSASSTTEVAALSGSRLGEPPRASPETAAGLRSVADHAGDSLSLPHTSPRLAPAAFSDAKGKRSATARIADALSADTAAAPAVSVDPRVVAGAVTVGTPSDNVKTMATVTVPSLADATAAAGDGKMENGVRAAEAAGHRRALAGVAHGRIDVPELGKIEVRAVAEASKIDVHVKAEETHTKHVIVAHAPELSAHVHREIPEARVHVERPVDFANDASSRDLGRNHEERREAKREERETTGGRPTSARAENPTLDRSRARVRIVL